MKRFALIILAALFLWPQSVSAHDVPDNVNIIAFLKPENGHMLILVRMPANALIDFLFPTLADGNWLDLHQAKGLPTDAAKVWIADLLSINENGAALPTPTIISARLSRADDAAFNSFQTALDHISGDPLPTTTLVTQDTATVDALLETPIHFPTSNFSFEPRFERVGVRVNTTLSFLPASGAVQLFQYEGDPETFELNPSWHYAVSRFIKAGYKHYINQSDYLLFLLCIALIFRRIPTLAKFSIAFAAAQTCALLGSLYLAPSAPWTPVLCGILIAAATVYACIEAIVTNGVANKSTDLAILTGLIFGSGFWYGLQPAIQFAGAHRLAATIGFNFGVTLAEIVALALLSAAVRIILRYSNAPRPVAIIAAAVAIHISWHRMLDRAQSFTLVSSTLPAISPSAILFTAIIATAAFTVFAYYQRSRNQLATNR